MSTDPACRGPQGPEGPVGPQGPPGVGEYRAGSATIEAGNNSDEVTFSSPLPSSNVIVTLGVRDQNRSFSSNSCLPTVASVTASGFTLRWRTLGGNPCNVSNAVTVNFIAVALQ